MAINIDAGGIDNPVDSSGIVSLDYRFFLKQPSFLSQYLDNIVYNYLYETGYIDANYTMSGFDKLRYPLYSITSINNSNILGKSSASYTFSPNVGLFLNTGKSIFYLTDSGIVEMRYEDVQGNSGVLNINSNFVIQTTEDYEHEYTGQIIPSENVLLVYNERLPQSRDLKDYYTGLRTGLAGLNILPLNCFSGTYCEIGNATDYEREIRSPIYQYIRTGTKPIKYCIFMYGIPTRLTGVGGNWSDFFGGTVGLNSGITGSIHGDLAFTLYHSSGACRPESLDVGKTFKQYGHYIYGENPAPENYTAVSYRGGFYYFYNTCFRYPIFQTEASDNFLYGKYYATTFLPTHIFGNDAADVSGYIKKISTEGRVDGVYLRGNGQNTGYILVSASSFGYPDDRFLPIYNYLTGVYSGLNDQIQHFDRETWSGMHKELDGTGQATSSSSYRLVTGKNISAFLSWGIHTAHGYDPRDHWHSIQYTQNIVLTGDSNWFITAHNESYGGMNKFNDGSASYWYGPPIKQWASNAHLGTGYLKIPVGHYASTNEPGDTDNSNVFMIKSWESGKPWIECYYGGTAAPLYGSRGFLCFGDPFICK